MEQLCKDLCVKAEQGDPIQEDQWGTRGVLELWFQEIKNDYIVLHIQKKHSSHKKRYLQDLELLLSDLDNIKYIANYQEIHYSGHLCR